MHVYVHPVTPESPPPLPSGLCLVISTHQNIACHTAHSNIHCQTNNHACANQKSISRQILTQKKLFCKLCACKQNHSSVVGRLTETDQIQIRDDTTSRACLRTGCYTGTTTAVTTRIISDFQPSKHCMPYIQISIVKRRTIHVNQKSISHRIITACGQGVNVRYFKRHH